MKRKIIWIFVVLFCVAYPIILLSSDRWPTSVCITNGVFDETKCREKASWIAVGTLADIRHLNYPSDFPRTEFTLLVTKWDKGSSKMMKMNRIKSLESEFIKPIEPDTPVRVYGYQKVKYEFQKKYGIFYIEILDKNE